MDDKSQPKNYGKSWSRDELILAFDLYCRVPFNKTKANNPEVISLAELLVRSPASVARKLGNFGSFDPELKKRQVSGLIHISKLDAEIWEEFNDDWNRLVLEATRLRDEMQLPSVKPADMDERLVTPQGPSEKESNRKIRIHQAFFREAILSSYEQTCCITGLKIREILVASHIIPWSISEKLRTDPHNGLCLSATFDRLFERGLITISSNFEVVVSESLRLSKDVRTEKLVCTYHGTPIIRPHKFMPKQEHLEWHRSNVFHD